MTSLHFAIRALLYLACGSSLVVACGLFGARLWGLFSPSDYQAVLYTQLQLGVLSDLAKTMIPTVGSFVALAGGAVGYLHKLRFFDRPGYQLGAFGAFALAVISLGCWAAVLACVIDAAGAFDGAGLVLDLDERKVRFLNLVYGNAVTATQIGGLAFFSAVGVVAIMSTYLVVPPPELAAAGSRPKEDPPSESGG